MIKQWAKFLLFTIGMFLIGASWATVVVEAPESVLQERASGVFVVRIEKKEMLMAGGTWCGTRYRASILKTIKGDSSKQDINFGFYSALEAGREYKIYVMPRLTHSELVANFIERRLDANEAEKWVSKCLDLIPQQIYFRSIKLNQNQESMGAPISRPGSIE